MAKRKKPKIAIISLTSCEGCQFAMLDLGQKFLALLKDVELDEFRLLKDGRSTSEHYNICFVEGNPITSENISLLKEMRKKSDFLVVLGNCAALGGVWEMKNYKSKQDIVKKIYKTTKVANPNIKEVDNFVEVDFTIPGCPITGGEFLEVVGQMLLGKKPKIDQSPVCYECQTAGYECLLQKGEICLGPITLGGCDAVCLKSKQDCWGCRGLFEGAQVRNFMEYLLKNFTREEIYRVLEVFGARDSVLGELSNSKK